MTIKVTESKNVETLEEVKEIKLGELFYAKEIQTIINEAEARGITVEEVFAQRLFTERPEELTEIWV